MRDLAHVLVSSRWRPLIALAAGAVYPLGFAPFGAWPATIVAIALLFALLLPVDTKRSAFWTGWWFGVGKFAVGVSWVYVSIRVYGSASVPLAVGLVALFVAGMALFAGLSACFVATRGGPLERGVVFVAAWIGVEWLLTWFLTGFPWLFAGYAAFGLPIVHWAPVGGVMLVSVAMVSTGVAIVWLVVERSRAAWIGAGTTLAIWVAGALLGGIAWTAPGAVKQVALVQGDIPQEIKWNRAYTGMIRERYERLSDPVWDADLVLWPEAAVTTWWPESRPYLEQLSAQGRADFVTGVPVVEFIDGEAWVYNGAVLAAGTSQNEYKKRRLVPFGDYVPFESMLRGLIAFFDLPMSNARPGPDDQPVFRTDSGLTIGMAICYEVAYGDLVRRDAATADVLATISNDTWFGASIGPHQHLEVARMRALETGRYVLRATNNGLTAIIDPSGTLTATLPQFEQGVLMGEFRAMGGSTPYVRYGNLLVFIVFGALVGSVFFLRRFD